MATNPISQNIGTAGSLASLFTGLTGSNSTQTQSGGTTTKQTILDEETLQAILRSGLESVQGLASVSQGQRTAGLYNTTTNSLLSNDLLSRLSAQAAIAGAPTVQTSTPTKIQTKTPGALSGLSSLLLPVGGAMLLGKDGRAKVLETLGLGGGEAAAAATGFDFTSALNSDLSAIQASNAAGGLSAATAAGDSAALAGGFDFSSFMGGIDGGVGAAASTAGGLMDEAAIAAADEFGGAGLTAMDSGGSVMGTQLFGETTLGDALPYAGSVLNLAEGDVGGAAGSAAGTYIGMQLGGPVGAVIGSIIGDSIFGDGGCFITTAVTSLQGKSDSCEELQILRGFRDSWLKENHPEDIERYYAEAPGIVSALKSRSDVAAIFHSFYKHFIIPAVAAIQEGESGKAYSIYTKLFHVASSLAKENSNG